MCKRRVGLLVLASVVAPNVLAIVQPLDCNVNVASLLDPNFMDEFVRSQNDRLAERDYLVLGRNTERPVRGRNKSQCLTYHGVEEGECIERRCWILLR